MSRFELVPEDRIIMSPSSKDGISPYEEEKIRLSTCTFIRNLCKDLELYPFKTIIQSYKTHDPFIIASGCCFLAAKVEESFRKPDMIAKCFITYQKKIPDSNSINNLKMKILLAERIILNILSFDLIVEQPYGAIMTLTQKLNVDDRVLQSAWKFANDSVQTTVSIQYNENIIACACIYLSILGHRIMPIEDAKSTLIMSSNADESTLMKCVKTLKELYPNFDELF